LKEFCDIEGERRAGGRLR